MTAICVFSGSQSGSDSAFSAAARSVATKIAADGHTMVYGGGSVGLMGQMADTLLEHSGKVIGVIPEALARVELMHDRVDDMRIVSDMHERKALMHSLADAYIAMPGGYGTLEEIFETLCWAQLKFHSAPIAILNINGFYNGLVSLLDGMVQQQFLSSTHRTIPYIASSVDELTSWISSLPR